MSNFIIIVTTLTQGVSWTRGHIWCAAGDLTGGQGEDQQLDRLGREGGRHHPAGREECQGWLRSGNEGSLRSCIILRRLMTTLTATLLVPPSLPTWTKVCWYNLYDSEHNNVALPGMEAYKNEIFGPVLCVLNADTLEEAIELVNR